MFGRRAKAIEIIPFKINNLEDFLPDSNGYPNLHPNSLEYENYWDDKTEECLYGIWGEDAYYKPNGQRVGGYRWMPGNMTFYHHHTPIEREIAGQRNKGLALPLIRDIDWFLFYDLVTCDGFAGFDNDKVYTCFRPVGKLQRGEQLTNDDKMLLDYYGDVLRDKNGKYKKYIEAREYLYQVFDQPMGAPLWLNDALNYMLLSTRRLGKSYIVINGVSLYGFTFNYSRNLDEYLDQLTSGTCIVGSGDSSKTKEFFSKWGVSYDWLRTEVGSYDDGRMVESGYWWKKTSGSVASENSLLSDRVNVEGGHGKTGAGNKLWHVSYARSASKGAGQSQNDSVVEEVGLTPDVEDIHRENTPAQESDRKFGKSIYIGTGGDFELIEASKNMFYKPRAFDILECENKFVHGGRPTARFVPATYYKSQYRDEHGNQNVKSAFEDLMVERAEKENLDTRQYLGHKASYPVTPDEIFVKADGNRFPVKNFENRREAIKQGALPHSTGKIAFYDVRNSEAYWLADPDLKPLLTMEDLTEDAVDKRGAMMQYESPRPYRPKRKLNDMLPMYVVFLEPVRNDVGTSFQYLYVWKFFDFNDPSAYQDNIVFEWFGRIPNNNDLNLSAVMDVAAYYDANIFAEVNNDAIKGTARRQKRYPWLIAAPGIIEGIEAQNRKQHDVGYYVPPGANKSLEKATNEFFREEIDYEERIEGGEMFRTSVIRADTLNSQIGCEQMIHYHEDGNFDVYDGYRLRAIWGLMTKGVDEQYADTDADKKLLQFYQKQARDRVTSRRVKYKKAIKMRGGLY